MTGFVKNNYEWTTDTPSTEEWRNLPCCLSHVVCLFSLCNLGFFFLLSNCYPEYFTLRACMSLPLYLHIGSGCVSSSTDYLNLKQPLDRPVITEWQLHILEDMLNTFSSGCPNTITIDSVREIYTVLLTNFSVCFYKLQEHECLFPEE